MEVAHRGYLLETGRVKLSASAAELRESEVVRQAYLGAAPGTGDATADGTGDRTADGEGDHA
jgi:hypothetical protein